MCLDAREELGMKKKQVREASLKIWKVVCEGLGLTLKKEGIVVLRKRARAVVNQIGDPKKDYHFVVYKFGKRTKTEFVVSSEQGLMDFQRRRKRPQRRS
jgi:hypothetical protein